MINLSEYNAQSITVMSDMQHMRLRYGMYIGDADNPRQLFSEAFDNAIDESQSGYSNLTEVMVDTKNHIYTVRDYGRGIPHRRLSKGSGGKQICCGIC